MPGSGAPPDSPNPENASPVAPLGISLELDVEPGTPDKGSPRPGTYVIDPQFPGTTGDRWKDYAFCSLIFDAARGRRGLARDARGRLRGARHAAFRSEL